MSEQILVQILDEIKNINQRLGSLETRFDMMDSRQSEMYRILRGLEENKEVNKAKVNRIEVDLEELKNHEHTIILKAAPTKSNSITS